MLPFKLVCSDGYYLPIGEHVFPAQKYRRVCERLLATGLAQPEDFVAPEPATDRDVLLVHTGAWVSKLRTGTLSATEELQMEIPYSQELVQAFWLAAGGSILAGQHALSDTICINLGGGFPTNYTKTVPTVKTSGTAIFRALRKHFGNRIPETIIEPGRGLVGNAGLIEAEVVLVSKKSEEDDVRWVYLDIGKFGGLAETMDESIRYPIRTPRDGDATSPCVLAGPTCDSADVLYEKEPYLLPVSLEIGDKVLIEGTGAYTATYASVAFNGFAPLKTYHI